MEGAMVDISCKGGLGWMEVGGGCVVALAIFS